MADTLTVTSDGLLLDEILAVRFGPVRTRTERIVEATLAINPGLASRLVLTPGTVIVLPTMPAASARSARAINLFG